MKMTTWTSEGEMKPRDVTLAQAFSIVFHDFLCHKGNRSLHFDGGPITAVTYRRPPHVLSMKEVTFIGDADEYFLISLFGFYYLKMHHACIDFIHSSHYSKLSPYYVVFGTKSSVTSFEDYEEIISSNRVRMANAAMLMVFDIDLVDEPHIEYLLGVSFENLVAFLMLVRESAPDGVVEHLKPGRVIASGFVPRFIKENYQLCS